jgi:anti-anti-sigma factor
VTAPFRLAVASFRELPVVRLSGGMVFGQNVRELTDRVAALVGRGHHRVILDVSELEWADSTGIGALLGAKRLVDDEGCIFLMGASERLRASMSMIRAMEMFTFVSDEADLLQHLEPAASAKPSKLQ